MDIDRFKDVNDLLGHYAGDTVLRDFGHTLYSIGRIGDITGRIGGDELMLFLDDVESVDQVDSFCSDLCKKARKSYSHKAGNSLTISTSIGALLFNQPYPFKELYQAADKLLYKAKKNGRNDYVLSSITRTKISNNPHRFWTV